MPRVATNFLIISNSQTVNHVSSFKKNNTHSDQVPGAEEPVDLGWLCE